MICAIIAIQRGGQCQPSPAGGASYWLFSNLGGKQSNLLWAPYFLGSGPQEFLIRPYQGAPVYMRGKLSPCYQEGLSTDSSLQATANFYAAHLVGRVIATWQSGPILSPGISPLLTPWTL